MNWKSLKRLIAAGSLLLLLQGCLALPPISANFLGGIKGDIGSNFDVTPAIPEHALARTGACLKFIAANTARPELTRTRDQLTTLSGASSESSCRTKVVVYLKLYVLDHTAAGLGGEIHITTESGQETVSQFRASVSSRTWRDDLEDRLLNLVAGKLKNMVS